MRKRTQSREFALQVLYQVDITGGDGREALSLLVQTQEKPVDPQVSDFALELVSGTNGIGALIWMSWETLATERLYVGILMAASLGIAMHRALVALEAALVPWRE